MVRNIVYTIIFSTWIGLVLVLLSTVSHHYRSAGEFFETLRDNLLISNIIGFTFHLTYNALAPLLRRLSRLPLWAQVGWYSLLSLVIVQVGALAASFIPGYEEIRTWMGSMQWFTSSLVIAFIISLIISLAWQTRFSSLTREAALARGRERVQAAERAALEANLRALQAQIEPHFLFNTLANVVSLIDSQPAKARLMLQDFIDYLRASLAASRAQHSSLGREADLMRAFLRLIKIRMGDRLSYRLEIPDVLTDLPFPPMLLQPLIENAVKHGLEPAIEGGEVVIRATAQEGFIDILVEDNGLGFQGDAQSGVGLANVRERLAGLYGPTASLVIEGREPTGTRVLLRVPERKSQSQLFEAVA